MKEANGRTVRLAHPPGTVNLPPGQEDPARRTPAGYLREFLHNRFVYVLVSPRARGLSVGINMNPDRQCQFNCLYCEVDRSLEAGPALDVHLMATELKETLEYVRAGRLRELHAYRKVPDELLQLRHVALSGDGEPTLAPQFAEALQAVMHVRALSGLTFFKIVLITNAVGLDLPGVERGILRLTSRDEVWAKLDGGTQEYLNRMNGIHVPLDKILSNILHVARSRPVIIQSLFPAVNGNEPSADEIEAYAGRLRALKEAGAQIPLVQIYSATRPILRPECGHLALKTLSAIALKVRQLTGLRAEVF